MLGFARLLRDRRGGMVEKVAVIAGLIGLGSIGGAHYLDHATRDGNSQLVAFFRRAPGVDYTPTASIRRQAGQTVLDPCTGKAK